MKINVNDKVRLKLTEHGQIATAMCEYLKYDKPDADGWLELHLWEAMLVFGPFMFNGNPNIPFETNIELKAAVTEEILNKAVTEMARQDITFAHCDKTWQERAMRAVLEAVLK